MISLDMIIEQVEQQVMTAKNSSSEQQKRESLSAIRALCDVALQSPVATTRQAPVMPKNSSSQQIVAMQQPQMMQQSSSMMSTSNQGNKLQEEDANGDSLFDF